MTTFSLFSHSCWVIPFLQSCVSSKGIPKGNHPQVWNRILQMTRTRNWMRKWTDYWRCFLSWRGRSYWRWVEIQQRPFSSSAQTSGISQVNLLDLYCSVTRCQTYFDWFYWLYCMLTNFRLNVRTYLIIYQSTIIWTLFIRCSPF